MCKMAELAYKLDEDMQQDDPEIEYYMVHEYIGKWTPTLENWYNKKYANPRHYKPKWCQYVGFDNKVEDLF